MSKQKIFTVVCYKDGIVTFAGGMDNGFTTAYRFANLPKQTTLIVESLEESNNLLSSLWTELRDAQDNYGYKLEFKWIDDYFFKDSTKKEGK